MMVEQQELATLLEGVEGWLPLEGAQYLSDCARQAEQAIVEIGAFRGRSTISLCHGIHQSRQGGQVYSIEPHLKFTGAFGGEFGPQDREIYFKNLHESGLAKYAALVGLTSVEAAEGWSRKIDVLFIDGDHRYEAVKSDVDSWVPHMTIGGLVVFDDTYIPDSGPLLVFHQLLETGRFEEVEAEGKLRSLRVKSA